MTSQDFWNIIHGPVKGFVYAIYRGTNYIIGPHLKKEKRDFKSNELKRLCAAWDLAFEQWEKGLEIKDYRTFDNYALLLYFRNVAFTIVDEDGPYLKLLYCLLAAWQQVKEDDKYLQ